MSPNSQRSGLPRARPPEPGSMMTTLLTEQEAATLLNVTAKALQGWRYRGAGPVFCKVGRCVRYRLEDLQAFVLGRPPGPPRAILALRPHLHNPYAAR